MSHESYFMVEVPAMLKKLNSTATREWGTMNPEQMLDHLRRALDQSLRNSPTEIITPEEDLEGYRRFLMSDKPFRPGSEMPKELAQMEAFDGDLESHKVNLMKSVVKMLVHFEKNPEHASVHPYFGEMNVDMWLQLHRKHITHHLAQFGIKPE